jgi:hypothetical protein
MFHMAVYRNGPRDRVLRDSDAYVLPISPIGADWKSVDETKRTAARRPQ